MKRPLVILTGPTAVGKTELSVALAKRVGGEIISADSMQVYRHMDIGSAKIRPEQMRGVPHHLINVLEPTEDFNVAVFKQKCLECMERIYGAGRIPILAGGTGFYIQAVLYDVDFSHEEEDAAYRERLERIASAPGGRSELHRRLEETDEASAAAIHENNTKRVIRALEYFHLTGKRISEHNESERAKEAAYNACYFVLNDERRNLYRRIEERVDAMLAEGLVEEVERLRRMGCHRGQVSMQGLGYKEILACLEGEYPLEEAVRLIKRDTRRFAKRQLTWFRREKDVVWLDKPAFGYDEGRILDYITQCLRRKAII